MADYGEILEFLAANPPQFAAERELHASLLEMIAKCLRSDSMAAEEEEASHAACKPGVFVGWISIESMSEQKTSRGLLPRGP